jgi:hypothetical protein
MRERRQRKAAPLARAPSAGAKALNRYDDA